jgi:hypothetical protein
MNQFSERQYPLQNRMHPHQLEDQEGKTAHTVFQSFGDVVVWGAKTCNYIDKKLAL